MEVLLFISQISLLDSIEKLSIFNQDNFIDFNGWQSLKNISGSFTISYCDSLENIDGLPDDIQMNSLYFYNNESLKRLDGMNSVMKLNHLTVSHNNSLIVYDFLKDLKYANKISIMYNRSLKPWGY